MDEIGLIELCFGVGECIGTYLEVSKKSVSVRANVSAKPEASYNGCGVLYTFTDDLQA